MAVQQSNLEVIMDETSLAVELTDKGTKWRNFPDCKKRGTAEAIDVLPHRQCLIKMYSKVFDQALKGDVISANICRLTADQTILIV